MIEPTPGRIVWFRPGEYEHSLRNDSDQPLAAIVTHVWGPRMVNLSVFTRDGALVSRTSVPLLQEGDTPNPIASYAEWMPYQKGQAAKHDAAAKT